jgi:hypothetical protein
MIGPEAVARRVDLLIERGVNFVERPTKAAESLVYCAKWPDCAIHRRTSLAKIEADPENKLCGPCSYVFSYMMA